MRRVLFAVTTFLLASGAAFAADHADAPSVGGVARTDANITDLHVFTHGENLVIAVSTNAAIPKSAASFAWSPDVTFNVFVDHKADVAFDDAAANAKFGGTLQDPANITERIQFSVNVGADGQPHLDVTGVKGHWRNEVKFFAGLRDDPFIRGPRQGRNVNAFVIEVPLAGVIQSAPHPTLLVWAVSEVITANGSVQADLAGRALRNMFPENQALNGLTPAEHYTQLGVAPDAVIFDTSKPAAYPNGRALTDDVVDLVGDSRVLANDTPFPSTNDRPFLAEFPYLSEPHAPVP